MGVRRIVLAFVALLVVAGLVLGAVSGIFASLAHQGLEAAGLEARPSPTVLWSQVSDPTPSASGSASTAAPSPDPSTSVALPAPVLAGTEGDGKVSAAAVAVTDGHRARPSSRSGTPVGRARPILHGPAQPHAEARGDRLPSAGRALW